MNISKSQKLYSQALQFMPGGVNSPVRAFKNVGKTPLFIEKAKGSRYMTLTVMNTSITFAHGVLIFSDMHIRK